MWPEFPENAPQGSIEQLQAAVWEPPHPDVFLTYNCDFERKFITDAVTGGAPWIYTYKVSLHMWPEALRHTNQVLRYWRGLILDRALAMPPPLSGSGRLGDGTPVG